MENDHFKDLLLANSDKMLIKDNTYQPSGHGTMPRNRSISEYLKYGIVNIDKPSNPSSHEVVTWVKNILNCEKTGHSGTLDPKVTGVLTICLDRATKLAKTNQNSGKTYVCLIKFNQNVNLKDFQGAVKKLTGHLFQRPPLQCAVKRELRLRWIYEIKIIEFQPEQALFEVRCEAGSYIRTLCTHIGLFLGVESYMNDLRRIKSGNVEENELFTLHDLQDAFYLYKNYNEEKYLRKIIQPMEYLLVKYPRIMLKDSAVNAVCYGGQLSIKGVYKYDTNIDTNTLVVLITAKGEAVALAQPLIASCEFNDLTTGIITKTKRVLMDKDLYPRNWGIMTEYEIYSESGNLLESK